MKVLKYIIRGILILIGLIFIAIIGFTGYVLSIDEAPTPEVATKDYKLPELVKIGSERYLGDNWLTKNEHGLYEMYISGAPYERGLKAGILEDSLLTLQEEAFTTQIKRMIPSEKYLKFLKYIIGFVNRDLSDHVTEEYKEEIYGVSQSAAKGTFDWIGSNYARQLNYHSAHDVGHALQNMMLVGCTSFAAWDSQTEDSSLIVGRNFDFWVGDEFAVRKIVAFVKPDQGHAFAYVTWAGFSGVVSGMNDKGLTVTINALPSKIPWATATPVSLVAREILQYAANIQEATAIAKKRKMFVSESFLVASAADNKAVIIEKTPKKMDVVNPTNDYITSTNHFQGIQLNGLERNMEAKQGSASLYRKYRLEQLIHEQHPLNVQQVAAILRNREGLNNKDIGWGNEKAINQLIAHHAIIMKPKQLELWISTTNFQLGPMVKYDLKEVFHQHKKPVNGTVSVKAEELPADSFLATQDFNSFKYFRKIKLNTMYDYGKQFQFNKDSFMFSNPNYYDTYRILGDYYEFAGDILKAEEMYQIALTKEIATEGERKSIVKKLAALKGR